MARLGARFERLAQGKERRNHTVYGDEPVTLLEIPTGDIEPDPDQPRQDLGDLGELQASIAAHGILQPLIVSMHDLGRYRIIAGERRWSAARAVGLETVPAIVRTVEDHLRLEWQLIENIQRKGLNPLEEARSYRRLMDEFNLTQEEIATKIGKSQPYVNQMLRMLALPEAVQQEYQTSDNVSKSVLLEIAKVEDETNQTALWEQAKSGQLTVQQARQHKPVRREPRPQPVVREITTTEAVITVRFRKEMATTEDLRSALEEALKGLTPEAA